MEYQRPIADWEIGNEIEGFYVLKSAQQRTSNSGKPFLNATLADRTGAVEAKRGTSLTSRTWSPPRPSTPRTPGRSCRRRWTTCGTATTRPCAGG